MMLCVKYSHMLWAMCLRIDQNLELSRTIMRCVSNHAVWGGVEEPWCVVDQKIQLKWHLH